ncbi:MAG: hypothetical protein FWG56_01900, partial [Desulfovibrionaceae bacterium]|nr:hypothetical protein [Desulfovibrionaceae bacterium]
GVTFTTTLPREPAPLAPIPAFPRFAEEGVTAKPQNFDAIALLTPSSRLEAVAKVIWSSFKNRSA